MPILCACWQRLVLGELSKALSSEVDKADRVSKHCGKIDTMPVEEEERGV